MGAIKMFNRFELMIGICSNILICVYIKKSKIKHIFSYKNPKIHRITKCGGPDLNRRTPAGMDPESIAFNLARQPPLWYPKLFRSILKNSKYYIISKICIYDRVNGEFKLNIMGFRTRFSFLLVHTLA